MHHTKLLLVDYLGNTYFGVFFLNEWQELFDFIHKIVRPSFTIRLDMEQAVNNIENDSEVIEYISQYVEQQNKLIEETTQMPRKRVDTISQRS